MLSIKVKRSIVFIVLAIVLLVILTIYFNNRTQPIEYFVLEPRDVSETIVSTGHISAMEVVEMAFETAGTIQNIYVKEGDRVQSGDVIIAQKNDLEQTALALLQKQLSSALNAAQEKVLQAELEAEQRHKELNRREVLAEAGAISQTELENARNADEMATSSLNLARQELENKTLNNTSASAIQLHQARLNLERKRLLAPMEGQILSIDKYRGEYVQAGVVVAKMAASFPVVIIEMDEKQLLKTKPGQRVLVSPQADPSMILEGSISSIGTSVDSDTGAYTIKCTLQNFPAGLKPNSTVNAEIIISEEKQVLALPKEYLRKIPGGSEAIFWNDGNPIAKPVKIIKNLNDYMIVAGIPKRTILINPTQFQSGSKYRLGSAKGSE